MEKANGKAPKRQIETVEEISGWVTTKMAADLLGIAPASVSAKITEKRFRVVRIAGILLCEKESVLQYAANRDRKKEESTTKKLTSFDWGSVSKLLESLPPEERAKVLAQLNGQE